MTIAKLRWPKKKLEDALAPRAMGDGEPDVYTPDERRLLIRLGLGYGRGLMKARQAAANSEQAEAFRRRSEIIWIFRGLPANFRRQPSGQKTKDAVLDRLEQIGIMSSERTLMRDYKALGGTKFLSDVRPFAPGEDRSPLLAAYRPRKTSSKSDG